MDLNDKKGNDLKKFPIDNQLKNYINGSTRIKQVFYGKTKSFKTTKTLLDVMIHNQDLVLEAKTVNCSFSDYKFVMASFVIKSQKFERLSKIDRNLCEENVQQIVDEIKKLDF
jgi:hypothetical protein